MDITQAFPSNYLKASDIEGNDMTLNMKSVKMEQIGSTNEQKPVLYFYDHELGLMLNKTNANNIVHMYGKNTDDWSGQGLTLFKAWVDFQGKTVEAIRVRMPSRQQQTSAPRQQQSHQAPLDSDFPGDRPISQDEHPYAPRRQGR